MCLGYRLGWGNAHLPPSLMIYLWIYKFSFFPARKNFPPLHIVNNFSWGRFGNIALTNKRKHSLKTKSSGFYSENGHSTYNIPVISAKLLSLVFRRAIGDPRLCHRPFIVYIQSNFLHALSPHVRCAQVTDDTMGKEEGLGQEMKMGLEKKPTHTP